MAVEARVMPVGGQDGAQPAGPLGVFRAPIAAGILASREQARPLYTQCKCRCPLQDLVSNMVNLLSVSYIVFHRVRPIWLYDAQRP